MDLLSQIEAKKKILRATKTILTDETGDRYEIFNGVERKMAEKSLPFVVDNKPDMEIAPITEGLFLSSQDPVMNEESLRIHRIGHVLSLGIRVAVQYEGINYHFLEFLDLPEFDVTRVIKESLRIIHDHRKDNVLVHCNAGVSRSATIVIAYLMALERLTYDEAYKKVKSIRNCIRPNDGFVRQLKTFSNFDDMQDMFSKSHTESLKN